MPGITQALFMHDGNGGGPAPAVVGQALLYTGNGATQSITGADFSPDLVVVKRRVPAASNSNWAWDDNVRGINKSIFSNSQGTENISGSVTSFDANGFSVGATVQHNNSGDAFLALVLQRVAGAFDIVTYTGTGVAHAENHGLGVVPELILIKNRSVGTHDWFVYPGPLTTPEGKILRFNTNAGFANNSTAWNNTAPSSTQFTVGTAAQTNNNGSSFVAYLFASDGSGCKVGSYTGDGNTNGPAITDPGFRPKFMIIKRTDSTGNWVIFDDQRDSSSPHNTYGHTNLGGTSTVDNTTTNSAGGLDFQAMGFQSIDSAAADINISGATYIYLAIA